MICAIVLAAGESRRMGSHKLLLPFGSTTVIAHIVDQLLLSAVNKVLVVVGHDEEHVVEQLPGSSAEVVANPNYRTGMLSSVRCGLQALPQECEAVMVTLGDQPALTSELVDEIIRSFSATDKGILVPVYSGRRGHPLLFSAHYRDEILTHYDDVGLRGLMRTHPDDILDLEVSTPAVLSDMDYPEDYRRELESLDDKT